MRYSWIAEQSTKTSLCRRQRVGISIRRFVVVFAFEVFLQVWSIYKQPNTQKNRRNCAYDYEGRCCGLWRCSSLSKRNDACQQRVEIRFDRLSGVRAIVHIKRKNPVCQSMLCSVCETLDGTVLWVVVLLLFIFLAFGMRLNSCLDSLATAVNCFGEANSRQSKTQWWRLWSMTAIEIVLVAMHFSMRDINSLAFRMAKTTTIIISSLCFSNRSMNVENTHFTKVSFLAEPLRMGMVNCSNDQTSEMNSCLHSSTQNMSISDSTQVSSTDINQNNNIFLYKKKISQRVIDARWERDWASFAVSRCLDPFAALHHLQHLQRKTTNNSLVKFTFKKLEK